MWSIKCLSKIDRNHRLTATFFKHFLALSQLLVNGVLNLEFLDFELWFFYILSQSRLISFESDCLTVCEHEIVIIYTFPIKRFVNMNI